MNELLINGLLVLVLCGQLWLCFKARRTVVKLIPALSVLLLLILCFAAYAFSDWTNWAFLILMVPLLVILAADAAAWLLFGVVELLKKLGK